MNSVVIAALVAAQAPPHALHSSQELVEFDGIESKMIVQCSCNVRLTLTVPRKADAVEPAKTTKKTDKGADDGS